MPQRRGKRPSWMIVLIVVSLCCASAFFIARSIVHRRTPSVRDAILLQADPMQEIQPLGDGVLYYDGMSLHALDGRGRQIWTRSVGSAADFTVDSYGISAWNDTQLTLLSSGGDPIHSADMQKTVLSAHVGEKYAAIQLGDEYDSELAIIERDRGGRVVDRISFSNLTVLDYGFFNNGNLLWALTLNTEGTTPLSAISTYQPNRITAGTISESDQTIYKVIFQASKIRAVGTKYIRSYSYQAKENPEDRMLVYGWQAVSADKESSNPMIAFAPADQTGAVARVSDVRMIMGVQDQRIHFTVPCFSVIVNKNTLFGFSNEYVFVVRQGEKKPTAYALPVYADNVFGITDSQSAIISSGGSVYLVPMSI